MDGLLMPLKMKKSFFCGQKKSKNRKIRGQIEKFEWHIQACSTMASPIAETN
jgi:hypothetical protein